MLYGQMNVGTPKPLPFCLRNLILGSGVTACFLYLRTLNVRWDREGTPAGLYGPLLEVSQFWHVGKGPVLLNGRVGLSLPLVRLDRDDLEADPFLTSLGVRVRLDELFRR